MADGSFLDRLAASSRETLEKIGRRRTLARGQVLFFEHDEGYDVNVLLDGQVKASISTASGREVILDVIDAGSLLGELSAIDGEPRSATVTALTQIEVLKVPVTDFVAYLETHPDASTAVVRMLAERLRNASQRQLEFGTSDALGRLCVYLIRMYDRYGTDDDGLRRVTLPLSQTDVAAMTGLSREAVVKGLRALRTLGWIDTSNREVMILDPDAIQIRSES